MKTARLAETQIEKLTGRLIKMAAALPRPIFFFSLTLLAYLSMFFYGLSFSEWLSYPRSIFAFLLGEADLWIFMSWILPLTFWILAYSLFMRCVYTILECLAFDKILKISPGHSDIRATVRGLTALENLIFVITTLVVIFLFEFSDSNLTRRAIEKSVHKVIIGFFALILTLQTVVNFKAVVDRRNFPNLNRLPQKILLASFPSLFLLSWLILFFPTRAIFRTYLIVMVFVASGLLKLFSESGHGGGFL